MRIGVDLLGGESSPEDLYDAVLMALGSMDDSDTFVVYATRESLPSQFVLGQEERLADKRASRIDLHLVTTCISDEEEPLSALRQKKDSSLIVGICQLSKGKIDAFVSAGNTGALIASSTIMLPHFPGVDCLPLLALLPSEKRPFALIDVGGLVSFLPEHLVQFAHMAAAYQRCREGVEVPTVGLLNIGEESRKGTRGVKGAYQLLQEASAAPDARINFIGNVEGREVFQGRVDVLVTDGFTGNVMLKTAEGISSYILGHLSEALKDVSCSETHRTIEEMKRHFSYDEYPGAIVCGVEGVVVKCHGAASKKGFMHSIIGAADLVKAGFLSQIRGEFPQG